jgi:hypothetical protein
MPVEVGSTWEIRTSKAVLLIRILVGWVFLSEGIQKFLFPDSLGVGRFVKINIPWPQTMAPCRQTNNRKQNPLQSQWPE